MVQKLFSSQFVWTRVAIWFLPIPFICTYTYLHRFDYIDGGAMATVLFSMFWSLSYMVYLSGESIYRMLSKKEKPWLGLAIVGIIIGIWALVLGSVNLIWYLQ